MARILELYDHPPGHGRVVCVDEFRPCNKLSDAYKSVIADQRGVSEEFVESLRRRLRKESSWIVSTTDATGDLSIAEWAARSAPESNSNSRNFLGC